MICIDCKNKDSQKKKYATDKVSLRIKQSHFSNRNVSETEALSSTYGKIHITHTNHTRVYTHFKIGKISSTFYNLSILPFI